MPQAAPGSQVVRDQERLVTIYDDRFEQSPLLNALTDVGDALTELDDAEGLTDEQVHQIERARRCNRVVAAWANDADPMLVPADVLTGLAQQLNRVASVLSAFASGKDAAQLVQLDTLLDAVLVAGHQLQSAHALTGNPDDLREHVTNYRRSSGQLLGGVRKGVDQLGQQVQELNQSIESAGAVQTERLSELETAVKQNKATGERAVTELREKFSSAQEERQDRFREALEEKRKELDALLATVKDDSAESRTGLEDHAAETLAELAQAQERAKKLVDTVGAIGTSGGYGAYAAQQKKAADSWRRAAVAVAGVAALVAIVTLILSEPSPPWQTLVTKFAIISALGGIAAYAGRQSGHHRAEETEA